MNGLEHATPAVIVLLVAAFLLLYREFKRINKGFEHNIRRIPGVDAIEGAVGRCAEQGRAVSFTTALTDVVPVIYAGLGVLR